MENPDAFALLGPAVFALAVGGEHGVTRSLDCASKRRSIVSQCSSVLSCAVSPRNAEDVVRRAGVHFQATPFQQSATTRAASSRAGTVVLWQSRLAGCTSLAEVPSRILQSNPPPLKESRI